MQPQLIGNLTQPERLHRQLTVIQEVALTAHDRLRHPQDRRKPLLHVAHGPACFLQLRREVGVARLAMALEQIGVHAIEAHLRHHCRVERGCPLAANLAHDHVRRHKARVGGTESPAGPRLKPPYQVACLRHSVFGNSERARQPRDVAHRKAVQIFGNDALRQSVHCHAGRIVILAQLQQQTFTQITRTNARWLQRLHQLQRDRHFVVVGHRVETRECFQLGKLHSQETIIVEAVNDRCH